MSIQGFFHHIMPLCLCLALPSLAIASQQNVHVLETSSTGKTVRLNIGEKAGLKLNEAVLLKSEDQSLATLRVIKVHGDSAVATVVEDYSGGKPISTGAYSLVYGEPMNEDPRTTDYIPNKNSAEENPANEKFFTPEGKELSATPELDDENYDPEVKLRPKFPESRNYSTNSITLGMQIFRNHETAATDGSNRTGYTTHQGYSFRYAYTYRTSYWLKEKKPALFSIEPGVGIYNFPFVPNSTTGAEVRVVALSLELRYLIELSKLFYIYPYIGFQNNIVSSNGTTSTALEPLRGQRFLAGAGGQLLLSDVVDARVEAGLDGLLLGLVAKF